jgi:DNA replication and repair protein RecF
VPFEADRVLIVGPNGRGKSNILEAISYLSIGKSVRGARDWQAVPHGETSFDVQAECTEGQHHRLLRLFYGRREGKTAFVDGAPLLRLADLVGTFPTVHFSPEDVSLVLRFPAQRRRLLDLLISQSSVEYLRDLQRYQHVLMQRNHLLRNGRPPRSALPGATKFQEGRPSTEARTLEPWDAQLVQLGAQLRGRRLKALVSLGKFLRQYYGRFSSAHEEAAIEYRGTQGAEREELEEELRGQLDQHRRQERLLGHTLCGAHRDDLVFVLNGQPAEGFASEGQLKTMLLSWKLAEARYLEQQRGCQPVLLLDDALSELDAHRASQVLEIADEFNQVLITTPHEPEPAFGARFVRLRLPK